MSSSGGGAKVMQNTEGDGTPIVEAYSIEQSSGGGSKTRVEAEVLTAQPDGKLRRKWAHGFCDICYVDKEHDNKFFPFCFPYAWPFSCIMTGKLVTLYARDERPVCCEMDSMGTICCILGAFTGYFTGGLYCCIHSMFYRGDLVYKYNVNIKL